ncbi:MAG: helicase-related protein [Planctomycetota bacterium]
MSEMKKPIPEILNRTMQSDRHRLRRKWLQIQPDEQREIQESQWQKQAAQSATLYESRAKIRPTCEYDPELPISNHREEILGLLNERQALVVCGETGSGKSTQLPKFLLDAGFGISGLIGHTQPRRIAARSVAARLAEELGTSVGEKVGFKIRFTDATKENTLIKLMTDGVLLAETQSDRFLDQYDALIIDEAHERSLNIDFLLGYLRKILAKRPNLKLILTSATIDPERFANHFADEQGPAPIVEVSGRTYPVEIRYRPPTEELDGDTFGDDEEQGRAIANAVDELEAEGRGDILTFLATERDIRSAAKYLRGHFVAKGQEKAVDILPLYARLSQAEQNKIFSRQSKRRIILSTNVAESSLTVPGIRYVIDTGLVRISRYAPRSRVQRLPIERVSQASANQRSGRCGRVGPGICIRLFEEEDFEKRH